MHDCTRSLPDVFLRIGLVAVPEEEVEEEVSDIPCRCVWHGVPCDATATQEDGLCDWCGERRPGDLMDNPYAVFGPDGTFRGLGGGDNTPYNHQAGWNPIPATVRPTACWIPAPEGGE